MHNDIAFADIVTKNKKMLALLEYIRDVAVTLQPVLITGETGVGKELFAKAIHKASGLAGKFVAVNVAGLDDTMFSDTLFGHERGAFTGADKVRHGLVMQAADGTLLLDEIGDLNPASQIKLLRLLEEGEYLTLGSDRPQHADFRLLASTNQDLWYLQRINQFRKDLNFRLRTHHIDIPPLRERKDDIPLLVEHFLADAARSLNINKPTPPESLFTLLASYHFPGNVREMRSMIFDALSRHKGGPLSLDVFQTYLDQDWHKSSDNNIQPVATNGSLQFPEKLPTIKEMAAMLVDEAMRRAKGNQTMAAGLLGITQQALSKRLNKK